MKIIKIVFENLNSLVGKHEIDFAKDFGTQGIFAIVGPTGAGKTTILDAICLALYGQTPRLDKLSASENEIMSRQTGECFAEVIFETNKGEQFLCRWEQRRAKKSSDGKLQQCVHTISEPGKEKESWCEISKNKNQVLELITEKTGMSFENFTRSILLAQGNFAKFLQSNKDERADILEQITGTEIYSKISTKVHERNRDIQSELKNLKGQLENVEILDTETICKIETEIAELKKNAEEHQRKVDFITKGLQYQDNLRRNNEELKKNEESLQKLKEDESAFQPDAVRLAAARKTQEIETIYSDLLRNRTERDNADQEKISLEKDLPTYEQKLEAAQKEEAEAEIVYQHTTKIRDTERETIGKVREIDRVLNELNVNLRNADKRCKEISDEKSKHEEKLIDLKEDLSKTLDGESFKDLQQQHYETKSELTKLRDGKELSDWQNEKETANEITRRWNEVLTAFRNHVELRTKKSACETKISEIEKELAEICKKLELLEQEKEEKDKSVEGKQKIVDLETYRQQLEDGKPCPCCGSIVHPFAERNLPNENSLDVELKEAKRQQNEAAKKLKDTEHKKIKLESELKQQNEKRDELNHQMTQEDQKIDAAPQSVTDSEVIQTALVAAKSESERIGKRMTDIETLQKREREMHDRIDSAQKNRTKIESETEQFQQAEKELKIQEAERTELESKRQAEQKERTALFGEKNPDEYEKKLQADVDSALKNRDAKQNAKFEAEKEQNQIKQRLETAIKTVTEKTALIETAAAEFEKQYRLACFESEPQFAAARIQPTELKRLQDREKELQTRRETLTALHHEKNEFQKRTEKELAEHWASTSFGAEYSLQKEEELKAVSQTFNDEIGRCHQEIGSRQRNLEEDNERKAKRKGIGEVLEKMDQEALLWGTLDELIGSREGTKFKIFVQSLTFRYLIEHANRQLEKMNPRYLLVAKELKEEKQKDNKKEDKSQLELNIVDKYQSGLERSTKNLSGGESFLVSLALALGLSVMSSQKVRVDSLFLDEGFGTLDEEKLETVLNVLDGLRQDGKLIGIISHVPLIQERIPLQIQVCPKGGGQSSIKIKRYAD